FRPATSGRARGRYDCSRRPGQASRSTGGSPGSGPPLLTTRHRMLAAIQAAADTGTRTSYAPRAAA
ncbi:MAG: hypothetical protein ACRDOI_43285, partial [Trebonia sp.]